MDQPGTVTRKGGKAARAIGGNNINLGPQGNALIDKIYCASIPFSTATEQYFVATQAGKPGRAIYVEGRGAETFDTCIAQFRSGGTLGLVGGLRVLGSSRKTIMERLRLLKSRNIAPYDLETDCRDEVELLDTALKKILGGRALREDPRRPRRIGSKGGKAKGIAFEKRRNEIMAEEIVIRLWRQTKLSVDEVAAILGEPWSASTLRRKYGPR